MLDMLAPRFAVIAAMTLLSLAAAVPSHNYTKCYRENELRLQDYKVGNASRPASSSSSSAKKDSSSRGEEVGKRTGPYYIARELSYARARLSNFRLSLPQWRALLDSNDTRAIQIKADSDKKLEKEAKLRLLRRKLRLRPNDDVVQSKLLSLGRTEEEYKRRLRIWSRKSPMSKSKRDGLFHRINKFRFEIDRFKSTGETLPLKSITKRKYVKKGESVEQDAKYAAGNAKADRIDEIIEEMRRIFHTWPLDPLLYPLWLELDSWMQECHVKYRTIELPDTYPGVQQMTSRSRPRPPYQPHRLHPSELDAIHSRFSSTEAFVQSLFETGEESGKREEGGSTICSF